MQHKAEKYVTAYTDEYGVKHIAPYSFKHRNIYKKRKNNPFIEKKYRQERALHEYSNQHKQKEQKNLCG